MTELVFGHRNPDTDSVTSAIALAHLRSQGEKRAIPHVLGEISRETQYVLDYFKVEAPALLEDVKIQLKDLKYDTVKPFYKDLSILDAYRYMQRSDVRTLPIIDRETEKLTGMITMRDIAMSLVNRNQKYVESSYMNIVKGLNGYGVNKSDDEISGDISVVSYGLSQLLSNNAIDNESIVIVGERPDVIDYLIDVQVKLIMVTGVEKLPNYIIQKAKENKVNLIYTNDDTYNTTKNMFLTNSIGSIMVKNRLEVYNANDYLEDALKTIKTSGHSKFPLVDDEFKVVGMFGRTQLIHPKRKRVRLVDHNEFAQSAPGIEEAEILEVVDHHKIGDISTSLPINYTGLVVGSTNTILYNMYRLEDVAIPKHIAGLMLSGILSDTLILQSPTTTDRDRKAVEALAAIADVDYQTYGREMFREDTDLEGETVEEIFYTDYKKFNLEGEDVGVSQVFTINIDQILDRKQEFIDFIDTFSKEKKQTFTLLAVTDIIEQGSYLFFNSGARENLGLVFDTPMEQGTYIPDVVSRKKQLIPKLTDGIFLMRTQNS